MMTEKVATLLHAALLIERQAERLQSQFTHHLFSGGVRWTNEARRAECLDMTLTAAKLRRYAEAEGGATAREPSREG